VNGSLGSISGNLTPKGIEYCDALAEFTDVLVLMGTAPVHTATFNIICGCDDDDSDGFSGRPESPAKSSSPGSPSSKSSSKSKRRRFPAMSTSLLNELDGGECSGMSYDQIKTEYPEVWAERQRDKLNFRYPGLGGESYVDVINRLRPVIIELERQRRSVLVISHLAVLRCLFAYFTDCPLETMPYQDFGQNTLLELRPEPHGTKVEKRQLC